MAKTTKKLLFAMLMVVVVAFMAFGVMSLSACGEEEPSNTTVTYTVAITGSDVSNDAVALKTGSTTTLSAAVLADGVEDSTLASDIVWSTSSSSVATVSNGTVTAVAAGTANITATYGTVSAKVTVTVTDIVYTVEITGDDLDEDGALSFDITDGAIHSSVLTATVYADGESTTLAAEWSVSDATVVSCTGGTVIAQAAGTAIVTAYYGTGTATVNVTVTKTEEESALAVTLSGAGTLGGADVNVYLELDLENNTARLYETMTTMGMEFTIVSADSTDIYGSSLSGYDFGMAIAVGEGTITANDDGTYSVSFNYVISEDYTYVITFTVSEAEGVYTTSLAPLVALGLVDSVTAVSTSDSATTLAGTGTCGGTEVSVYLVLDLTNNTAKLYETMTTMGMEFTIVTPVTGEAYGSSLSGSTFGYEMVIPEGTITANTDGTYTVSFYYGYITFTVSESEGVYSTSLASLVSLGLLDTVTISGEADDEVVTVSAASTLGGADVNVYLELNLTDNTAKLYETMTTMGMEFTIVSADSTDIYGSSLSGYDFGMAIAVGEGTITANDDGTYSVSFNYVISEDYTYVITFTVSEAEGVYTTSLAPLVALGLVDSVTAISTADSATTLAGAGTLGGADVNVYLELDLTNSTAKLYETMTTMGMEFTIVTPVTGEAYGSSLSGSTFGSEMVIPEGTITANDDGTYTVSFYDGLIGFNVSESEGTYSTSLASLVSLGLLDTVTATSAVEDTTETTETTESAE